MPDTLQLKKTEKNLKKQVLKYGDLVFGINTCIANVKNENSSKEEKAFYLKMLVHLMGDLHQPMHIGRKEDFFISSGYMPRPLVALLWGSISISSVLNPLCPRYADTLTAEVLLPTPPF